MHKLLPASHWYIWRLLVLVQLCQYEFVASLTLLTWCARGADVDPSDHSLQRRVGQLLHRAGQFTEAVTKYKAALDPDDPAKELLLDIGNQLQQNTAVPAQ